MSWSAVKGQQRQIDAFRQMVAHGRLANTFLFVGPAGVGKRLFATHLAQALLCETNPPEMLDACGTCPACQQVMAGSHPDVISVKCPPEKAFIPLELFIGDRDHRMQVGLCHDISLKPYSGRRKIAIIDDADLLNAEGANCLLKTLEEPPGNSVIILIGTSEHVQLPTIRSRSQIARFSRLSDQQVAEILIDQGLETDRAQEVAGLAEGSMEQASVWLDESLNEFVERFLRRLASTEIDGHVWHKEIKEFLEPFNSVPAKRLRVRTLIATATRFYRSCLRAVADAPLELSGAWKKAVTQTTQRRPDADSLLRKLEVCHLVDGYVRRNSYLPAILDYWLDELINGSGPVRSMLP